MYQGPWKTRRIGRQVIYLPEAASTNTEALRLARQHQLADGSVVVAGHQSGGRGQGQNQWITAPGLNLTLSVYLEKPVGTEHLFRLNIISSLAVRDTLKVHLSQVSVQLKWPNDVYINGRKIAGILIESGIQGSAVQYAVAGIGLNVNQTEFAVNTATSMSLCSGNRFDLEHIFGDLILAMDRRLDQLQGNGWSELVDDWLQHMYLRNICHRFRSETGYVTGTIRGIDEAGRLVLETDEGLKTFLQRELVY